MACTRLVLCRPEDPGYPLPFERTCAGTIDRSIVDPQAMPRGTIAEVSRFAVAAGYRRRRGEHNLPISVSAESFGGAVRPRFPYIPIALSLGITELAALHGIETMFMLTERKLAAHFARLGVDIKQIGGPVEHRGTRVPSMLKVRKIIDGLNFIMRPLYKVIAADVQRGLQSTRGVGVVYKQAPRPASR